MNKHLSFGVILPTGTAQWGAGTDPRQLIDFAVRAERLGYASVWANDSLLTPRIEALTMLAALAPVTERVTLGTAALMPVLRRPVQAAQTIASVDLLSGGRLVLAVGAAFPGRFGQPMHVLSEVPWERRFTRLDETISLWRQIWTSDQPGAFHGAVLHFDHLPVGTKPVQPGGPPIWLGGFTQAAFERTGRIYDGWLPYPPDPADYASGLASVRQAATEAGRAPDAIEPGLFTTLLLADSVEGGRATLDAYARQNYGVPLDVLETIQALIAGPPEQIVAGLRSYVAAGARHIAFRIGALDLASQLVQLERLAEVIAQV